MAQYTRNTDEVSEMFLDSLLGGGGVHIDCSCGETHYAEGYKHSLEETSEFEGEFVYYKELEGLCFVDHCEGCKKRLLKYENFIWNSRDSIRRYLKTRIDQEYAWAEQEKIKNKLIE